jgi:hypothetical protein
MRVNGREGKAAIRRRVVTEKTGSADHGSSEHPILRLQRQVGNRVVAGLMGQPGAPMIVQRLAFFNTDWTRATQARRSGSGATGVLFVEDGTPNPLVVKSGEDPVRETVLAHVMHEKLGRGEVKVPPIRPERPGERQQIMQVIREKLRPTFDQYREDRNFKRKVIEQFQEAPTLFIMGMATGQEFKQIVEQHPDDAGALLRNPTYVKRLGMVTAIDLFIGNTDRLYSANLGNWMTAIVNGEAIISLIDNFDPAGAQHLNPARQDLWKDSFLPKIITQNLRDTAVEILNDLLFNINKINQGFQLNDAERDAFITNFVSGMQEGRSRILSKLAPRIGRRSRTLKRAAMQGGAPDAWNLLKKRARLLKRQSK